MANVNILRKSRLAARIWECLFGRRRGPVAINIALNHKNKYKQRAGDWILGTYDICLKIENDQEIVAVLNFYISCG